MTARMTTTGERMEFAMAAAEHYRRAVAIFAEAVRTAKEEAPWQRPALDRCVQTAGAAETRARRSLYEALDEIRGERPYEAEAMFARANGYVPAAEAVCDFEPAGVA